MANIEADKLARDLVRLLGEIVGLYDEMAGHMKTKLEAIRQADTGRIQSLTAREMTLAEKVEQREGLRRHITKKLVKTLGLRTPEDFQLKLSELAEHLAEPRRSQLLGVATGLRDKADKIENLRITTTLITQEMLKHLNHVLSIMTSGGPEAEVYSPNGQRGQNGSPCVFDAVG